MSHAKLQEIVELLDREADIKKWLKAKVAAAIADKNPMERKNLAQLSRSGPPLREDRAIKTRQIPSRR